MHLCSCRAVLVKASRHVQGNGPAEFPPVSFVWQRSWKDCAKRACLKMTLIFLKVHESHKKGDGHGSASLQGEVHSLRTQTGLGGARLLIVDTNPGSQNFGPIVQPKTWCEPMPVFPRQLFFVLFCLVFFFHWILWCTYALMLVGPNFWEVGSFAVSNGCEICLLPRRQILSPPWSNHNAPFSLVPIDHLTPYLRTTDVENVSSETCVVHR